MRGNCSIAQDGFEGNPVRCCGAPGYQGYPAHGELRLQLTHPMPLGLRVIKKIPERTARINQNKMATGSILGLAQTR